MPAVSPDGPTAGSGRTARRGRFVMSAVLLALVVAVGSGVGTFALQDGFAVAATPTDASTTSPASGIGQSVECGLSSRCVPSLRATEVIRPLEARGFFCEQSSGAWMCDLFIGTTHFDLYLAPPYGEDDTQVENIAASVVVAPETDLNDTVAPYLTWAAAIPFGSDPAGLQVRQWATQQIESGNDARAKIGGYTYAFTHQRVPSGRAIRLEIDPVLGFEDQLWGDG